MEVCLSSRRSDVHDACVLEEMCMHMTPTTMRLHLRFLDTLHTLISRPDGQHKNLYTNNLLPSKVTSVIPLPIDTVDQSIVSILFQRLTVTFCH